MLTLEDLEVKGKTVFVRTDLNSPVEDGEVKMNERLRGAGKTLKELAEKGAKVVVLSHQGRKKRIDFIPLEQHSKMLGEVIGKEIKFVDDVCGEKAKGAIKEVKEGEIVLLDNVRNLEDETTPASVEEAKNSKIVRELKEFCDIFVLDGFSVSHRSQASVVGFSDCKVAAGRVMQKELENLNRAKNPERPLAFVLGGAKPEDSLGILENWLREGLIDDALCCGVLGTLLIKARVGDVGEKTEQWLEESGAVKYMEKAKELLEKYPEKIRVPKDVAVEMEGMRVQIDLENLPAKYPVKDIGVGTAREYAEIIENAKTVIMNGPAGVYEDDRFTKGTEIILKAVADSGSFSLAGGGHTIFAIEKFNIDKNDISYISLAGKALIQYLSGKELPGVKILEKG